MESLNLFKSHERMTSSYVSLSGVMAVPADSLAAYSGTNSESA